jgi:hypothetical protein
VSFKQSPGSPRPLSPVDMRDIYLTKHAQDVMRIEETFVGMVEELRRLRTDLVGRVRMRSGDTSAMIELRDSMEGSPHHPPGVLPDGSQSLMGMLQGVFKTLPSRPGSARRGRPKILPGNPDTGYSLEYFAYRAGISLTTVKREIRRGVLQRNLAGRIPHEFLEAYVQGQPMPVRPRRAR